MYGNVALATYVWIPPAQGIFGAQASLNLIFCLLISGSACTFCLLVEASLLPTGSLCNTGEA